MKRLAVFLLVLGMWTQHGWTLMTADLARQGAVWNASQQTTMLVLLGALAVLSGSWSMTLVCVLLGLQSGLVVFCELWWLIDPKHQVAGEPVCQARFSFPLGAAQMGLGATLLYELVRSHGRPRD